MKMSSRSSKTVYVGNLPGDIREKEVEDLFRKASSILSFSIGYSLSSVFGDCDMFDTFHSNALCFSTLLI